MDDDGARPLRVLTVLEQLANTQYPQTLAQLTQRTGLPKTTLMRMLHSLEKAAYVARMPGDMGYAPGPRINHLAASVLRAPHFLRACRHVLGRLVAIIGESCNLTAPMGDAVHYLARVESAEPLRLQLHMEIGSHVPLHCTASGKLFLALAPELQRRQILDRIELPRYTPKTLCDRQALERELRRIRGQGIGVDDEEFVRGMVAIAVPVYDDNDQVLAAIACHAPTAQRTMAELLGYIAPMREAAHEMSAVFRTTAQVRD
ncbi:IclR family transcriptional regulator [Paracandidimonas lactea]|uniref:IclR family transcriptional regulator n=1 Tax=Paracandidimonas lactea TaxID=2895524 RepID=UPI0019251A8B|nr:IclR family transcriptional regulator [Paracandidimonas lactea]